MQNVDILFKTTVDEIERMLNGKTVVGDSVTIEGNTIIPLVSVGFGFAAGSGGGKEQNKAEGSGVGTGGGGGVKPVAILIINKDGVRLESVKSGTASVIEKVAEAIAKTTKKTEAEVTV